MISYFELKYKIFSDISQTDSISKTFAQRHYLSFGDSKISENMEWLRKDAAFKWELDKIAQLGPNWREHMEAAENTEAEAMGGSPETSPSGLGGASGGTAIPEFGEASANAETGAAPETTPEGEATPPAENTGEMPQPI